MLSTLRMFKALPITDRANLAVDKDLYAQTIRMGFVFSAEVIGNYPDTKKLMKLVDGLYGRDPEKLNKAFHKSFSKVRDASLTQLYYEQIIHYMTTYGAERMGVYDSDSVYIPAEELNAPEITEDIRLVVIRGLTYEELKAKLLALLGSGVALSEESVSDAVDIAALVVLEEEDIVQVANREVKTALYDHFGLVPSDPVEFLRYLNYKVTGKTLLIKNNDLIDAIKVGVGGVGSHKTLPLFIRYEREHGLNRLAEVFNRFKPIFLAYRADNKLRPVINKIRRLAESNHKPMPVDYLNSVTALIGQNKLSLTQLSRELKGVNTFRKIRLAHALKNRTNPNMDSIVYKVRNGKAYATFLDNSRWYGAEEAYDLVLGSIVNDLKSKVDGRGIYIPEGVVYGLPATEKQFTGNLPSGTYVNVPGDMVAGVYWEDQGSHRIDLDLSMVQAGEKIGWDASYRNSGQQVYFSGDITSAPKGATEVFHIGRKAYGVWMLNLNYFNFNESVPAPFKIVVGSQSKDAINQNYLIDANHLLAASTSVMDVKQKSLGIIVCDGDTRRFYFSESAMGGGISARQTVPAEQARKFMYRSMINAPTLNEVLLLAGAQIVADPKFALIDLSPETIDKTTLLELLS